jgi:hypothetical protein
MTSEGFRAKFNEEISQFGHGSLEPGGVGLAGAPHLYVSGDFSATAVMQP